ncbi:MAG: S49 family peptidase [Candidatus Babeliaceae bacterium]|nr:S49 family peptidase [Candidatus Babeliaceae bacterium]
MKKYLLTVFFWAYALTADIQLLRNQPLNAVNIGYISLTDAITDFNELVKKLKNFAEDSTIDTIILHINSPGGSPGSSQIIADFITWVKQTKPVIAFISDSGTSGAYWIAAACTYILAPETAIIGSIGVAHELPKKNKTLSFTAGKYKRPHYLADGVIDPDDQKKIQERLDLMYDIFCKSIATLRSIPVETLKSLEAQVFLGVQARELGLIDQNGTIRDVFDVAVDLTKNKKSAPATLIRVIVSPTEVFEFAL